MTSNDEASPTPTDRSSGEGRSGLQVIAGMKIVEGVLLIATGIGALGLLDPDSQHRLVDWLDELSLREGRRITSHIASKAIEMLGGTTIERLKLIAVGCFVYASVFIVESIGLWLGKRWAEYLTVVVTASLLPFEALEVAHRVSASRVATFVVNLVVVAYLIRRLVAQRAGPASAKTAPHAARAPK